MCAVLDSSALPILFPFVGSQILTLEDFHVMEVKNVSIDVVNCAHFSSNSKRKLRGAAGRLPAGFTDFIGYSPPAERCCPVEHSPVSFHALCIAGGSGLDQLGLVSQDGRTRGTAIQRNSPP